jgi:hypothetical protein
MHEPQQTVRDEVQRMLQTTNSAIEEAVKDLCSLPAGPQADAERRYLCARQHRLEERYKTLAQVLDLIDAEG